MNTKKKAVLIVLAVLPLLLFSFIFSCGGGGDDDKNECQEGIPIPEVDPNDMAIVSVPQYDDEWWTDRHNDKIKNVKTNQKIIFIGNSITHWWENETSWTELNQRYNNKITNLGYAGDQTQHVIWRLENGEFPKGINAEYVVVKIGTNNAWSAPESTAAGIGKIIEIINKNSSSSKIILVSILPRGSGNDDEHTKRNNAVNEIIKNYDGCSRIQYLNLAQYYINNNGKLKSELFTDGLHLSPAGYKIWKEKLMEIIK